METTPCTVYIVEALVDGVWAGVSQLGPTSFSFGTGCVHAFTNKTQAVALRDTVWALKFDLKVTDVRIIRRVSRAGQK